MAVGREGRMKEGVQVVANLCSENDWIIHGGGRQLVRGEELEGMAMAVV